MAATRRAYTGAAVSTTTASSIAASGTTSFTITAYTGWPYGTDPFYVVVEPGTASEEKILVTRTGSTDTTINIASDSERGQDGTSAVAHSSGSTVFPVFTALDADEANAVASVITADTTNGRVGIGTATPSDELDVVGSASVSGDLTVDTDTLHVDSANNRVGIGTTSPTVALDISGDAPRLRIHDTDTALSNDEDAGRIEFSNSDSGGAGGTGAYIGAVGDGSAGAQSLVFGAGSAGSPAEVVRIDGTSSRVGINDSTPSYALDVTGDINATGNLRIGGTAIGTWTAYTPTFTGITVGNGTVDFRYCQINKLVALYGRFTLGSTSAITAGFYFTMPSGLNSAADPLWQGAGYLRVGGTNYIGSSARRTQSTGYCLLTNASGTYGTWGLPSNTVPASWSNGDYWVVSFVYEVD